MSRRSRMSNLGSLLIAAAGHRSGRARAVADRSYAASTRPLNVLRPRCGFQNVPIRTGKGGISLTSARRHARTVVKEFEFELAALRKRHHSSGFVGWLRSLRPFDLRTIL